LKRLMQCSLLGVSLMATVSAAVGKTVPREEMEVTVCVMNEAGIPGKVEEMVERRVDLLMERAAVHIRWLRGADPGKTAEVRCVCSHPDPMRVLILHWMKAGRQALPGELGQAFLGEDGQGAMADLFVEHMAGVAEERGVNFGQLLAHVTAHELGHLLLGANSHSVSGLMQARMNEESLARLARENAGFSAKQVERMHERKKAAEQSVTGWWRAAASCPGDGTRGPLIQAEAM